MKLELVRQKSSSEPKLHAHSTYCWACCDDKAVMALRITATAIWYLQRAAIAVYTAITNDFNNNTACCLYR